MELDFSNVKWADMEPMERFAFHRDHIFPKVDEYFRIKSINLGRDMAFDLAIDYTASLFKVGRDEVGRTPSRNLSTKTGMYLPVDVFDKYFKPFERQWKGQNRKEQAQIIADSYITQIEKNIESKKLDGFTNMDIQVYVIEPKIEEIQHQLKGLSLPSNKFLDDPDNNVIVKSRIIVLQYLKARFSKDKKDYPKEFKDLFYDIGNYNFIIDLLIKKGFIEQKSRKWTPPSNGHKTAKKYLTALYTVLIQRNYIRKAETDVIAAELLSKEFFPITNVNITKNRSAPDFDKIIEDYFFISNT